MKILGIKVSIECRKCQGMTTEWYNEKGYEGIRECSECGGSGQVDELMSLKEFADILEENSFHLVRHTS